MTREIKFRAWSKIEKEWVKDIIIDGFNGALISASDPNEYDFVDFDYDLMQYTGLKDKNGKEIYEGDIVESGVVTYMGGRFLILDNQTGDWEDLTGDEDEIIGNVFENPELLSNNLLKSDEK